MCLSSLVFICTGCCVVKPSMQPCIVRFDLGIIDFVIGIETRITIILQRMYNMEFNAVSLYVTVMVMVVTVSALPWNK